MHALVHTMLHTVELLLSFFFFFFSPPVQKGGDGWTVKNQCRTHRHLFPFPLLGMILTQSTEYRVALPPEIRAAKRNGGDPSGINARVIDSSQVILSSLRKHEAGFASCVEDKFDRGSKSHPNSPNGRRRLSISQSTSHQRDGPESKSST